MPKIIKKIKNSKILSKLENPIDKPFIIIVALLILFGAIIFSSASLMLIGTAKFNAVRFNQFGLGLLGGIIAAFIAYKTPISLLRKTSFYLYIISILFMIMVFVPGIGVFHGGARRWISLFGFQFQPSEIYKLTTILYLSLWLMKDFGKSLSNTLNFKSRTLPLIVVIGISSILLLLQPDTDTLGVILISSMILYLLSGGNFKDIAIISSICAVALLIVILSRPYVMKRVKTFLDPSLDPTGAGYQVQQSLIAIGSGGVFGRGYGQSIQKFKYLPEPIGDSVFAVSAEEFGFIGVLFLISLYIAFALSGLKIASRSSTYGSLVVSGIVSIIVIQSFLNISAMTGLLPLSGTPLIFISHGGTALLVSICSIGIILSAAREKTEKNIL